ncbi:class I SAM-dependent methyltransferase [Simkania negevensis]|uniref:Class I SAM-dependent methyltransferase n=1 Tax=Simkania negevensis TaxID=83561 RepID=A0ABS3ASH1_9BACT|nr:class I SAM-dependent methyltransferase [Simkania negevensis]
MGSLQHQSAKSSHYNKDAKHYDEFNEEKSAVINRTIEGLLQKYHVETLLDLTCGTGSQVFWFAKCGYEVTGSDFNANMLKIARGRAKKEKVGVKLLQGDVRTAQVGKFDAALTIFNAVGHLTKNDFEKAMRNINGNLHKGGLYIFDIFNLTFLAKEDNITSLTIDYLVTTSNTQARTIQYSTIDDNGTLASYTTSYKQKGRGTAKNSKSGQTLQVYTIKQLQEMLQQNGFKVVKRCNVDGSKFVENKSDRILIVAKKVGEANE